MPVHATVNWTWPITPWYSAVMVVVPQAAAVARPLLSIVATVVLLDAQLATLVSTLLLDAGEYTPRAINWVVCPS